MGMSRTLICSEFGNAEWLVALTLYFDTSIDHQNKAMDMILNTFMMLSFFSTTFSCAIDISLQIDLVLTLQRPLSNPRVRQISSIAFSLLFALIVGVVIGATGFIATNEILQVLFIG